MRAYETLEAPAVGREGRIMVPFEELLTGHALPVDQEWAHPLMEIRRYTCIARVDMNGDRTLRDEHVDTAIYDTDIDLFEEGLQRYGKISSSYRGTTLNLVFTCKIVNIEKYNNKIEFVAKIGQLDEIGRTPWWRRMRFKSFVRSRANEIISKKV